MRCEEGSLAPPRTARPRKSPLSTKPTPKRSQADPKVSPVASYSDEGCTPPSGAGRSVGELSAAHVIRIIADEVRFCVYGIAGKSVKPD